MALGFALWGVTIPFTLLAVFGNWNVAQAIEVEEEEQTDSSSLEAQRVIVNSDGKY